MHIRSQRRRVILGRGRMFFVCAATLLAAACGQPATSVQTPWEPLALQDDEPALEGREIIMRLTGFLGNQPEIMTEAFVTYQAMQDSGQKLHLDLLQQIVVHQPDKLYWKTLHDDASVETAWFSDGRFSLLKEPSNVWGQIDGPNEIPDMVDLLATQYGVTVPFRDLLSEGLANIWLSDEVTSVVYVGEAWVAGAWTDHVAIRKPGIDFELWIRKGPEPFLDKLTVVFTEEPGMPTHSARFLKWATTISDPAVFQPAVPTDAERVDMVPVSGR